MKLPRDISGGEVARRLARHYGVSDDFENFARDERAAPGARGTQP